MISHASIPHKYWDEIFSTVVYLINRLPPSSNNQIPYTTQFNVTPDYQFLRVIGCLCFPHTRQYNSNKLQLRSLPCVFLGYANNQKGYHCLHIDTNRIFTSRNVQFDEQQFPFSKASNGSFSSEEEDEHLNNATLFGPPLIDMYLRCIRPTSPQPTIVPTPQRA